MVLVLVLALPSVGSADRAFEEDPRGREGHGAGAVRVEILGTYPELYNTVAQGDAVYVRISYSSAVQIRFRVEARADGTLTERDMTTGTSPPYPAGDGEALVWIAFGKAARIDDIRIVATDRWWRPLLSVSVAAALEWAADRAHRSSPPEWVVRLISAQQERQTDEIDVRRQELSLERASLAVGPAGLALGIMSILVYAVLQPLLGLLLSGNWRMLALLPLIETVPLFGQTAYAFSQGSAIWDAGSVVGISLAAGYLIVVACAACCCERRASPPQPRSWPH